MIEILTRKYQGWKRLYNWYKSKGSKHTSK